MKHRGLAIVIGMGKPKPGDEPEEDSEAEDASGSYEQNESEYAKVILEAAKDGDPEQFGAALKAFVRSCVRKYAGGKDEEE